MIVAMFILQSSEEEITIVLLINDLGPGALPNSKPNFYAFYNQSKCTDEDLVIE